MRNWSGLEQKESKIRIFLLFFYPYFIVSAHFKFDATEFLILGRACLAPAHLTDARWRETRWPHSHRETIGLYTRNACRASELKLQTSAVGSSFRRLPLDGAGRPKPCFYYEQWSPLFIVFTLRHMGPCISFNYFLVSNRAIIKVTIVDTLLQVWESLMVSNV